MSTAESEFVPKLKRECHLQSGSDRLERTAPSPASELHDLGGDGNHSPAAEMHDLRLEDLLRMQDFVFPMLLGEKVIPRQG